MVSAGPRGVLEAELLELVEALGHDRTRVELDELARQLGEVALPDRLVVEREVGRERLVEHEAPERGVHEHAAVTVAAAAPQHDRVGVLVVALGELLRREPARRHAHLDVRVQRHTLGVVDRPSRCDRAA